MTALTDDLYEETLARIADGHIDLGGTLGIRRWCDGSGPCAVEMEPHGHWRGGVSVSTREVVLRLVRERDEARATISELDAYHIQRFAQETARCGSAIEATNVAQREANDVLRVVQGSREYPMAGLAVYVMEAIEKLERERDEARAEIDWLKRSITHVLQHPTLAGTFIEHHHPNCASHAGHACTCTYAPTIPSLGVKP